MVVMNEGLFFPLCLGMFLFLRGLVYFGRSFGGLVDG